MLKNGTRLRSQVCDTQVVVIRTSERLNDLQAGGIPMLPLEAEPAANVAADPELSDGNHLGKRYVDASGGEVLVTRAGSGTLSVGRTPLTLKAANPLPASD